MNLSKKRDRILSVLIDVLIYAFIILIFGIFFGVKTENGSQINGFPAFILFMISIGLWPLNEFITGQTFGKKILGIKVICKTTKKEIGLSQALLRFIFSFLDCFFLIGLIIASNNKSNQRIGDLIANTIVVDSKVKSL